MKIRILGMNCDIQICNDDEMGDGEWKGRAVYEKNLIKIADKGPDQIQRETLFHEILHFINNYLELKLNETSIGRLSQSIFAVMEDNPHLFQYKLK